MLNYGLWHLPPRQGAFMDEYGILAQGLGKQFDDFWAVRDVHLQVPYGEVLALLGPNGAGKTTTLRMLTAVLTPSRGRAWVAGHSVRHQPQQVRAAVGVLTEQHGLYKRMTAEEYLYFFGRLYGLDEPVLSQRVEKWLRFFDLWPHRQRRVGGYSKGMRQKLALARALMHEPRVLLLDEPTSAMDPASAYRVRAAIRELRSSERAIVVCTHNLTEAEQIADRIAILHQGRIAAVGSPEELKARLGPPEFEVVLGRALNGTLPDLPAFVEVTHVGPDRFRFRWTRGRSGQLNPLLLQGLLAQGWPVLTLAPVPRSLEQVYLEVVGHDDA